MNAVLQQLGKGADYNLDAWRCGGILSSVCLQRSRLKNNVQNISSCSMMFGQAETAAERQNY